MTIGKAVGGGYPVSGVLTTDDISQAAPWSQMSGSSSSYGGNALGAAAAAASLRIIEEERLVDNAREVGGLLLRELAAFEDRYPFVGHVSGVGMLLRIELVSDKTTKEALPRPVTERIFHECVKQGLLTMAYSAHVRLQPSLTLDAATARNGIQILRDVFDLVAAERWYA